MAGRDHDRVEQVASDLLGEPVEVAEVAIAGGGCELCLDREDAPAAALHDQVHLVVAVSRYRSPPIYATNRRISALPLAAGAETGSPLDTEVLGINRRFYERRGFEQTSEIILPGGPDTWWMRRAPKGMAAT